MPDRKKNVTYADAGVNIDAGNRAVELIKKTVQSTFRPGVLTGIGGFGGLFKLDVEEYREPVLVSGTDGVGTKLRVAFIADKHDTIGVDAVAMCVNDILTLGAEPLFFLDYLAVGRLEPEKVAQIVAGAAEGCRQAGCALIGGETAEMPDFYGDGEYDIAGFAVGVVDKAKIIDGKSIAPGDVAIGLPSSGLHSNGYSLARRVLLDNNQQPERVKAALGCSIIEEMLRPTRIYVPLVMPLVKAGRIKGIAHITGGGLLENVPRILPGGTSVQINTSAWEKPAVFNLIAETGPVAMQEMYRVFNMGIGMVLVVGAAEVNRLVDDLQRQGEDARIIGTVTEGDGTVQLL